MVGVSGGEFGSAVKSGCDLRFGVAGRRRMCLLAMLEMILETKTLRVYRGKLAAQVKGSFF